MKLALSSAPKRGRKEEATEADAVPESIEERLERLEKMVAMHDDEIRTQGAASMRTYLFPENNDLGKRLLLKQKEYNKEKPPRGPHPWGPPRRVLCAELCEFLLSSGRVQAETEFAKMHAGMRNHAELDEKSINYLTIKETHDKRYLLRVRPLAQATMIWTTAFDALDAYAKEQGGEKKTDPAPPGPLMRELRAQIKRNEG
eukprot:TRINITY_DN12083_c0_g1_i1.p2 TRINITY_DN12083_c0_g1~~TRINITY_DN12083_c0_g1_i1.p2  ORF type:complete len:201 (-),score=59.08 TRINITY_DN12083_c0_g1_i1:81-683(-)